MPAVPVRPPLPPAGPVVPAGPDLGRRLYEAVTPSLVAVQFTFTGEVQQVEQIVPGIVVDDHGLIMFALVSYLEPLPDQQLRRFKVIVPRTDSDNEELDATYEGRDERTDMAFVRVTPPKATSQPTPPRTWVPIHFADRVPAVGEPVYSVGILSRQGGYHSVLNGSTVSAHLRGPVKQVLTAGGGLAPYSGVVFDATGTAIGIVGWQYPTPPSIDDRNPQQEESLEGLVTNHTYLPTSEFALSLVDPPSGGHPIEMAYTGLPVLSGLKKDEADYRGLTGQPVVQVGDVLADSPAERAGLKPRDVIVKFDGHPLERGDTPEELPIILRHQLAQLPPGTPVTFSVLRGAPGQPLIDIHLTMGVRPMLANAAKRWWSDDIGFGVREPVVLDRYQRHMKPADAGGVVVTVLKPQGSAQSAELHPEDMVVAVNGQPTPTLAAFKSVYGEFRSAHAHEAIVMVVKREGREQTIRIEPPQ
jgi:S1-C subfamily serine protease